MQSYPYQIEEPQPKASVTQPLASSALNAMMSGRSEIAETRLAVTAVQIIERLRIRASHLDDLLKEELDADTQLIQLKNRPIVGGDMMGLESMLRQKVLQIQGERRRTDTECWRDMTNVMREFLNAWEGFSRNEAKNRFLNTLPVAPNNAPAQRYQVATPHTNHDQQNTPNKQRNGHSR